MVASEGRAEGFASAEGHGRDHILEDRHQEDNLHGNSDSNDTDTKGINGSANSQCQPVRDGWLLVYKACWQHTTVLMYVKLVKMAVGGGLKWGNGSQTTSMALKGAYRVLIAHDVIALRVNIHRHKPGHALVDEQSSRLEGHLDHNLPDKWHKHAWRHETAWGSGPGNLVVRARPAQDTCTGRMSA